MILLALYAVPGVGVRTVYESDGRVEVKTVRGLRVPSIVEEHPAAEWPEREAHDLYGIEFEGHDPMRPLIDHVENGSPWRVLVRGHGTHGVAVGPIHAGVIESGHFRFHVVGERILHLDLRLFYKHRGLERAAEGAPVASGIVFAHRACAACAVSNSIAYARASERVLGLEESRGMARSRKVLLELERLYNHLHDLSAICAGVGFAAGAMAFAGLKERAQRLNAELFGHRFLFGAVAVGRSEGVRVRSASGDVDAIVNDAATVWKEMLFNASVQDRLVGAGVLNHAAAVRLGAVGPTARAAGVAIDARTDVEPAAPEKATGDVAARAEVRHLELQATGRMLQELLGADLEESVATTGAGGDAVGVGRVESPRGETVCCVEARDGAVTRFHLRTASYRNWPALAEAVPGNILPEFPLINKSFELCYACVDR
jgi:Ni,Fe-hydrogenase III large subunit